MKKNHESLPPVSPQQVALDGLYKLEREIKLQIAALIATMPTRSATSPKVCPKAFDPRPMLKAMDKKRTRS